MAKEICFQLATNWGKFYTLDVDDGEGCTPKEIKPMGNHYEVFFTHGKFTVKVYAVAYAKFGDWEQLKTKETKVNLKVV